MAFLQTDNKVLPPNALKKYTGRILIIYTNIFLIGINKKKSRMILLIFR